MEECILAHKSNEIKWKVSNESKFSELAGHNETMIEKYKNGMVDL